MTNKASSKGQDETKETIHRKIFRVVEPIQMEYYYDIEASSKAEALRKYSEGGRYSGEEIIHVSKPRIDRVPIISHIGCGCLLDVSRGDAQ